MFEIAFNSLNVVSGFSENINRFGQACFYNCYSLQLIKSESVSDSGVFDIIAFNVPNIVLFFESAMIKANKNEYFCKLWRLFRAWIPVV